MIDALIVGAGPAGAACARTMAGAGAAVALIEAHPPRPFLLGEAATPDVLGLLQTLGLGIPPGAAPCRGHRSVWGGVDRVEDFPLGRVGLRLDRAAFHEHLLEGAQAAGVGLARPARLRGLSRQGETWTVAVEGPAGVEERCARLVIDASGRAAVVARALGARRQTVDTQVALACRTGPGQLDALGPRVLVVTAPEGWWYASTLPGGEGVICLFTDADLSRPLRRAAAWGEALERVEPLRSALAGELPTEDPLVVDASASCLNRAAGPGWLAMGDALLALDPLTSSGISGALRDGIDAAHSTLLPWLAGQSPAPLAAAWAARANRAWGRFLRERAGHLRAAGAAGTFWARRASGAPLRD